MKNIKLEISYDGTNYHGWQIQKNAVSVQEKIKSAIEIILREEINLLGSGRTDSGVHALGQVANFCTNKSFDLNKFLYSLNSILPSDISIKNIVQVADDFHARFDAKERSYLYLFSKNKNPFFEKYATQLKANQNFQIQILNDIAKQFIGIKDFTSFAKTKTEVNNKICEIFDIRFRKSNGLIYFYISANRFLHGMVRTILGTILEASKKDNPINYINSVFEEKNRSAAGKAVPAKGLFLFKVKY